MYESPISVFETISEMVNDIENQRNAKIMQQKQMHVEVDEKELIKALNYDREQYDKGFVDGAQWASQKEIPKKPAVHDDTGLEEFAKCECGAILLTTYGVRHKYCRECGQKIDWGKEE